MTLELRSTRRKVLHMKDKCIFCEEYRSHKAVNDFKRNHPEYYDDGYLLYEIKVAMVTRTWRPGYKRQASRVTDYRYRGCGYALNFCPECGRELKDKKKW